MTAREFLETARRLCRLAYRVNPPGEAAVDNAAWLLFITWAHESGQGQWRRQTRYLGERAMEHVGAFGCMQCEVGSIIDSLLMLQRDPRLREHIRMFLTDEGLPMFPLDEVNIDPLLYTLMRPEGDLISMVLARLHYLRKPERIPHGMGPQADYAKQYYNTIAGAATPADYASAGLDMLRKEWEWGNN